MKKEKKRFGPVITLIILIFVIILISSIASAIGMRGEITTITNGAIEQSSSKVKSIISKDGLDYFLSSPVNNFRAFEPLVLIIISLMAISIGKTSGLFKVIFTKFRRLKSGIITFLTLFIAIISSFFGAYSYVILIPLSAVIYQYLGKNSVYGILVTFIGITLGYSTGLVFNYEDYQLGLLTKVAAVTVDPSYQFNAWSSLFIMIASTFIIAIIGTIILETFLKPKIKESLIEDVKYNYSKKGLVISSLVFILFIILFIYMITPNLPGSGVLLDMDQKDYVAQLLGGNSTFNDAFIFMFLVVMMVCSGIYGYMSKNIKDTNDFSVGLSKEFDNLGYIFILMFFMSLLTSILTYTNLGEVVASLITSFIGNLEFTGIPLILITIIGIILMSILIPDLTTKWTIASPVIVPLFMKANITPDFTQFVFKIADSIGKGLTPLFIYFIVMLAFLEKYNKKESVKITVFGTLKQILPSVLLFAVLLILIVIGWYILGMPIGTDTNPTM